MTRWRRGRGRYTPGRHETARQATLPRPTTTRCRKAARRPAEVAGKRRRGRPAWSHGHAARRVDVGRRRGSEAGTPRCAPHRGRPALTRSPPQWRGAEGGGAAAARRARPRLYPTERVGHVASGRAAVVVAGDGKLAVPVNDFILADFGHVETQMPRREDLSQSRVCAGRTSQWCVVLLASNVCCHRLNIGKLAIRIHQQPLNLRTPERRHRNSGSPSGSRLPVSSFASPFESQRTAQSNEEEGGGLRRTNCSSVHAHNDKKKSTVQAS